MLTEKQNEFLFYLFNILNVLDVLTTYIGLELLNAYEYNPIMRYMFNNFGLLIPFMLKLFYGYFVMKLFYDKAFYLRSSILLFINSIYLFGVIGNFIVLYRNIYI